MYKLFFSVKLFVLFLLAAQLAWASEKLVGSWSLSDCAFSYEDTGVGGFNGSFSINREGLFKSSNILKFDGSGRFNSGFKLVDPKVFAGESLNLTQYKRWNFIEDSVPANGSILSGKLVLEPAIEGFSYTVLLSADKKLILTIKELYKVKSVKTAEGHMIKSGQVPMTYTLTFVPTPKQ